MSTAGQARGPAGLQVEHPVADDPGTGEIQAERLGGTQNHAGTRLAAGVGRMAVGRFGRCVKRAGEHHIERRAPGRQNRRYLLLGGLKLAPGVVSAPDTRLVGDHDRRQARAVGRGDQGGGARDQTHVLGPVQIADLRHQDAIPIEKQGRPTVQRHCLVGAQQL